MTTETSWPPRSPQAAFLNSPGGRRKLLQHQSDKENQTSPVTRSAVTSHLRYTAGSDPDIGKDEEDEDEDEETLQLKLAAIEAKLKLKKLQQSKAKAKEPLVGGEQWSQSRPGSTPSSLSTTGGRSQIFSSQVKIPVSPRKQQIHQQEQRSPGRILLGIDKGMTGADVSLRRARSIHGSPIKAHLNTASKQDRPSSRLTTSGSTRSATSNIGSATPKSFSERMAEARETERSRENKRDSVNRVRGSGLRLNEAELESYRLAAEEASKHNPPRSSVKQRPQTTFSRDEILRQDNKSLKKSRTLPNLRQSPSEAMVQKESADDDLGVSSSRADATLYEPFSHLNLSSRILPDSFLKRTLPSETYTCMRIPDLLREVTSPAYELPESVIDLALFGVIASKSSPMDHKTGTSVERSKADNEWQKKWEDGSQNQRRFMVLTITDLKWTVDLYFFGTAVPRYHRLSPGTVVAILNPSIMPPKKGKEDTGAFSLTLHSSDDTVLEIGTSRDLGFCNAVKKDGKQCGSWVNSSKTEICEFHLNLQVSKAQSKRMGVNAGSNGFGGGGGRESRKKFSMFTPGSRSREAGERDGLLPLKGGPRYDAFTGSQYYISSSSAGASGRGTGAPIYRSERSTARMLDQDDDDPFIAEGQFSRDKEGRMRKRLETQAKEKEIAKKLVAMSSGGAGGEYLRHRSEKIEGKTVPEIGSQRSATVNRNAILSSGSGANGNGKRTAESVRLSPVKKTRFVTDKGIKIAGRESLGPKTSHDDDDLDIV